MTESALVTLEREFLVDGHPARRGSDASRATRHNYVFPNGSEIICGGLDNPDRIMSTEYDMVLVVEATEVNEEAWEKLLTRLRNNQVPFQQAIAECNPSAPGHWLNKRAGDGKMARLISRHEDNPSLTPEYLDRLSKLTSHRRARLYLGIWAAAEGAVFPEFEEAVHCVDTFNPPSDWPWYVGWDPGYAHPTGIPWVTVSPSGDMFVGDEIYRGGLSVQQHCETVMRMMAGRTVRRWYGDPHEFFSMRAQGDSVAVQCRKAGLPNFYPWANQNKGAMVNGLRELLLNTINGKHPALYVMRNCVNTIMEFQTWAYKKKADGSLAGGSDDAFCDEFNHMMDSLIGMTQTGMLRYK